MFYVLFLCNLLCCVDELARLGYTFHYDSVTGACGIVGVEVEAGLLVAVDNNAWIPVECLAHVGAFANAIIACVVTWGVEFCRLLVAKRRNDF